MDEVISRQQAIDAIRDMQAFDDDNEQAYVYIDDLMAVFTDEEELPPAHEPEHTCVNCGRTANNGGWYADGRTRCPIEEHYALPKDGYCHLWEKRNVTDDDYPERREE